jgi:hypothetical protein
MTNDIVAKFAERIIFSPLCPKDCLLVPPHFDSIEPRRRSFIQKFMLNNGRLFDMRCDIKLTTL